METDCGVRMENSKLKIFMQDGTEVVKYIGLNKTGVRVSIVAYITNEATDRQDKYLVSLIST